MESRAHQDSIMIYYSRIGWTLFPSIPLDCFFPVYGGKEMERDMVMICVMMGANTNWAAIFFSPPFKGLLYKKLLYIYHIKGTCKCLSCMLRGNEVELC